LEERPPKIQAREYPQSRLCYLKADKPKEKPMTMLIKTLATVAVGTVLATSAFAQSAKEIRGGSPYPAIENEPAPKLIVDPPLAEGLAQGIFWAQYRVRSRSP
jgi:hypothetical protein